MVKSIVLSGLAIGRIRPPIGMTYNVIFSASRCRLPTKTARSTREFERAALQ
jgi:TRAP-type C4-dicarboxylate transport system permease large subunit